MYSLRYLTRGNRYPGEKPRIFVCMHPKDSGRVADLAKQILSLADCAIWYIQGNPESKEERRSLYSDLEQMRLAVVLVSKVFLEEYSLASQELLPFFSAEHIPILPLMLETGLDNAFSQKFGSLQYLAEFTESRYGRTYQEKLLTYLRSMLTNAPVKQINDCFRYRIFLSYRKKDRYYVANLMKAIHADPWLESAAIWYDDFLVPGESFEDNIANAIEQCDLFLIMVTPHLLEKNNYVETEEYPYAKRLGKIILPCEVAPTDRARLESHYPEIPPCVSLGQLSGVIRPLLQTDAKRPLSPMEDYYIGQAYLLGLNSELDVDHGLQLIRRSADSDFVDAMEYLVNTYRYGIGIQRSEPEALIWQKRMLGVLAAEANKENGKEAAHKLVTQSLELAYLFRESGYYNQAILQYRETLQFLSTHASAFKRYEGHLLELSCKESLASLGLYVGEKEWPEKLHEQVIQEVECLPEELKDFRIKRIAVLACEQMGMAFFQKGDYKTALSFFQRLLAIAKNVLEDQKCHNLFLHTSEIIGRLGGSLDVTELDDQDQITEMVYKDYAVANTKIGDVKLELQAFQEASDSYSEAEKTLGELVEMGLGNAPVRREIGLLHRKKADIYGELHEFSLARAELLEAVRAANAALKERNTEEGQWDLAVYLYQIAQTDYLLGNKREALENYKSGLKLAEQMAPIPRVVKLKDMFKSGIRQCKWRFFG